MDYKKTICAAYRPLDGESEEYYLDLPASKYYTEMLTDDESKYFAMVSSCEKVPELEDLEIKYSMEELDFIAKQIQRMNDTDLHAFRGLLKSPHVDASADAKKIVSLTFNLNNVDVYHCANKRELGIIALENDMFTEFEDMSDETLEMLDSEKVGERLMLNNCGVLVDGYYIESLAYNYENVYDGITLPEPQDNYLHRFYLTGPRGGEPIILDLPTTEDEIYEIESELRCPIENATKKNSMKAIPALEYSALKSMYELRSYNQILQEFKDLSPNDQVRCAAVWGATKDQCLDTLQDAIHQHDRYEIDPTVTNIQDYATVYLAKNLLPNFDIEILDDMDLRGFGYPVAKLLGVEITQSGAVSRIDGELYPTITREMIMEQNQEHTQKNEMGGMEMT